MDAAQPPNESVQQPRLLRGRYRIGARVGRGGVSDVYSAVDLQLARPVAVKLFRVPADDITAARMESEATLLAGLSHPGLLAVYDFDLDQHDRPYLVLQLIDGPTLRQRINDGPLDPVEVAELGGRLADTLAYLHDRDIIHRDLKPANVLLDSRGRCYLADFGIARAAGAARLTATGEFVGTAGYLAPEQLTDPHPGPAVDIYALGLVLIECLTGTPEYTGSEVEVALARLTRQPRIPDRLPPGWRTALTAMTIRDRDHRPTARQCAETLTELSTTAHTTPALLGRSARRRLRPLATATTAMTMAAVAAAGLGMNPTTIPGQPHAAAALTSPAQPRPQQPQPPPPAPPQPAPPSAGMNQAPGADTPVNSAGSGQQPQSDKRKPGPRDHAPRGGSSNQPAQQQADHRPARVPVAGRGLVAEGEQP